MNFLNEQGFTTINGGKHVLVEFTPGEMRATWLALHSNVAIVTPHEARSVFGSQASVRAAERALEKVTGAMTAIDK